jgi:hypothetical protein
MDKSAWCAYTREVTVEISKKVLDEDLPRNGPETFACSSNSPEMVQLRMAIRRGGLRSASLTQDEMTTISSFANAGAQSDGLHGNR